MKKKTKKQINQLSSMYDLLVSALLMLQCETDFDFESAIKLLNDSKLEYTRVTKDSNNGLYEIENEDFYDY